ncbi:MAG TPA: MarR family transcriptional regulator [Anaerolineales bacterium]|nr:MarR family transcriptional regulator [Anaerolineales bacterium]
MGSARALNKVLREWSEVFMRRSFRDFRHFMAQTGLSPSQVGTLMRLHYCQSAGVSDIGDHMGITAPAASQLVDRLVLQGLLERTEDPDDRRYKQVSLTTEGMHVVEEGIRARQAWMEELTSALTSEEQGRIIEVLVMLTEAARQLEAEQAF